MPSVNYEQPPVCEKGIAVALNYYGILIRTLTSSGVDGNFDLGK